MRINQAQVHHDLLVALRESTANQDHLVRFNRNLRFFAGAESALYNSTVVLLYGLYETRGDTVNFRQLLELAGSLIPAEALAEYRQRLEQIKQTWLRVCTLRNEVVGHQTLRRDRAAVELKADLKFSDVDSLLTHAKKLLFDISTRHFDTHPHYIENSRDAVDELLSRIAL
ncbi:hypothetical protein [Pseudoxanthomonas sp. X-1]|uniref:AbiU2 domain-containing protein n=1 Tax=Pseudoxanthomonas sp. X-1 TaxID=2571115 RepID=UPI00110BA9A1|nr:hypothetical protein [Pseudoxanthomonas sp. X-1]TMN25128.1 hypothetical protein FF950_03105 [Pseudoxanthomonas sp. X-1]UAY74857.1 hypothetical protein LAJ50_00840 [Pseudoxanthomonas sp. X-1]